MIVNKDDAVQLALNRSTKQPTGQSNPSRPVRSFGESIPLLSLISIVAHFCCRDDT